MDKDGDALQESFGDRGTKVTYVAVIDAGGVIRAFSAMGSANKRCPRRCRRTTR